MSFFKNVLSDLVEKRLWPVAVALVAALVAVPIILGGGSTDTGTATAGVPATTTNGLVNHRDAARAQVVSLEEQAAGKVQRAGALKNPFVQHHQPKVTTTSTTATTTDAGASSGSSSGGSSSTGGTEPTTTTKPDPTPTTTDTTPAPAPDADADAKDLYRVNLKFGEVGADRAHRNVARLTPLPSADNPFFVYLGPSDDKQSAIFLVDAAAIPSGDGKCLPSKDDCQQVSLKAGDVEFFDMQSGTAGVVEYQLTLDSIKKVTTSSAKAAAAHARESKAGRDYLRQLVADDPAALDGWDYSKRLGLLIRKDPETTPDVANVPSTVAEQASGQAVESTSTVLTVPGS
jgi:hypothetical protein